MKKTIRDEDMPATAGCTHWGYSGKDGPEHWGQLSGDYLTCSEGKNQSPIDLSGFVEADLKPIEIDYRSGGAEILHTGHTIQVNVSGGSTIAVDGRRFELRQYHFHAPSENRIEGRSFPMEAHLVHSDGDGRLAVVAVMIVEGAANESIARAWSRMPVSAGEARALPEIVDAAGILPPDRAHYRFTGSLTTPPCSEGVLWIVMKEPVTASKDQIETFSRIMGHPNNRPVQAVNARLVLK